MSPATLPANLATEEDLLYCYRLILDREPDPAGWEHWMGQIRAGSITLRQLTDAFLHSREVRYQRRLANDPELIELDEFKIWVHPYSVVVGRTVAIHRQYEPHVTRALRPWLTPGATFLDIGANVGYFTLLAAALVGPRGRVIAVEPNPDNADLLRRSLEDNGFAHVALHPFAAADREGTLTINPGEAAEDVTNGERPRSHDVRAVVLDDLLADLDRLDAVKIDIDGGEPMALRGLERLIRRHRPAIVTEFCPSLLAEVGRTRPEDYLAGLARLGYDLHLIDRRSGVSPSPMRPEDLLAAHAATGFTHVDLLARPR